MHELKLYPTYWFLTLIKLIYQAIDTNSLTSTVCYSILSTLVMG